MKEDIIIKNATIDDVDQIIEVEELAWKEEGAATRELFNSRFEVFPEGILVALKKDKIIGVCVTEIIDVDFTDRTYSWYEITDNGKLKKSHNIRGKYIYGVDLSVMPQYQGYGIGQQIVEKVVSIMIDKNFKKLLFGSRIPGYCQYADKLSVFDYVFSKDNDGNNLIIDPELKFYLREYRGSMMNAKKIIPNYFKDSKSLDYGVLVEWENPYYTADKSSG